MLEKIHMYPTLQETGDGREGVSIFLAFLLSRIVYFDSSEELSGGLKKKVLCSHWFC